MPITDNTGFDSLKQKTFTNDAAEWLVRSALVGVVLLVIVAPVALILHFISRRNSSDEAALITPAQVSRLNRIPEIHGVSKSLCPWTQKTHLILFPGFYLLLISECHLDLVLGDAT